MEGYTRHDFSRDGLDIVRSDRVYPEEATVNGESIAGRVKCLSKDIEESFVGKNFKVRCNGTNLYIFVKDEDNFTSEELTTLTRVIDDYKNNV